jgi:phosphoribosylformylglycinamidine cyclo-ligase
LSYRHFNCITSDNVRSVSAHTYEGAGVRGQERVLSSVLQHLGPTLSLAEGTDVVTRFGHYASVLRISDDLAIAISTDGVGTKTIVAAALERYDTIGFDCVAMNVNDILCVGARPLAMVDYIGVHELSPRRIDEILMGLGAAAKEAGVAVPGGELAQLPEVIGRDHFDLVGTCIGTVHPDRLVLGQAIEPGDAIVGIASSGIHSNGLTLARRVLLKVGGYRLDDEIGRLGRTLGEELLEPTAIYSRGILALWSADIETRGLAHITSDGLTNLCRLDADVGYVVEALPPVPEIFSLIAEVGEIGATEMFRVFNMGIGFIVVTPSTAAEDAVKILAAAGFRASRIGTVSDRARVVEIAPAGLRGGLQEGISYFVNTTDG